MLFKMSLWFCALMFVATLYNAVNAYDAIGAVNVQDKFVEVGLIQGDVSPKLPPRKPLQTEEFALNAN